MRNRRQNSLRWGVLGAAVLVVVILAVFGNYQYTKEATGGYDFLMRWNGLRSLLISGESPYSEAAGNQNQLLAYGRAAHPGEDILRETDPLYSVIFTIPVALIPDYPFARALWMTFLEGLLIATAVGTIRLTQWRVGFWGGLIFLVFSLTWYHAVLPLLNGNIIILVTFFIVAGLLAVRENADELAGVFFAFATINPEPILVFLIFILVWGILKSKWRMLGWMVGTVIVLGICAVLLIPDWLMQNLRAIILYPAEALEASPVTAIILWLPALGPRLGLILTLILSAMLIAFWILSVKSNFRGFLWTAALTLTLSQFFGTHSRPDYLIFLFPALVLVLAVVDERWRRRGQLVIGFILILLFAGLWAMALNSGLADITMRIQPVMYYPLPVFLIMTLFWIRWWAIHPPNDLVDPFFVGDPFRKSF
ncbi:MAG: glycosyltransferase family 87 protein [Anaerolineaceae bacterium]